MLLCSIYDSKTKMYSLPVVFASLEEAKRGYAFAINGLIGAPATADKSLLYFKKDMFLNVLCGYDQENEESPLVSVKKMDPICLDDIYQEYKTIFQEKEEALPKDAFIDDCKDVKEASRNFVETLKDDEVTQDELIESKENVKKAVLNLKKK